MQAFAYRHLVPSQELVVAVTAGEGACPSQPPGRCADAHQSRRRGDGAGRAADARHSYRIWNWC